MTIYFFDAILKLMENNNSHTNSKNSKLFIYLTVILIAFLIVGGQLYLTFRSRINTYIPQLGKTAQKLSPTVTPTKDSLLFKPDFKETSIKVSQDTSGMNVYQQEKPISDIYKSFKISFPKTWSAGGKSVEKPFKSFVLELKKDKTVINIVQQSPGSITSCLYQGDPEVKQGLSGKFSEYEEMTINKTVWRRGKFGDSNTYIICEKKSSSTSYSSPTSIGVISISNADKSILSEVDDILKKIVF